MNLVKERNYKYHYQIIIKQSLTFTLNITTFVITIFHIIIVIILFFNEFSALIIFIFLDKNSNKKTDCIVLFCSIMTHFNQNININNNVNKC